MDYHALGRAARPWASYFGLSAERTGERVPAIHLLEGVP